MYSYKRTPLSVEINKALKMLMVTLFVLLVATSTYFFVHMSINAEKGSVVRENQLRQKNLESENRLLKEQVLEAQSLNIIQKSDPVNDMEPSNQEMYVKPQVPISRENTTERRVID